MQAWWILRAHPCDRPVRSPTAQSGPSLHCTPQPTDPVLIFFRGSCRSCAPCERPEIELPSGCSVRRKWKARDAHFTGSLGEGTSESDSLPHEGPDFPLNSLCVQSAHGSRPASRSELDIGSCLCVLVKQSEAAKLEFCWNKQGCGPERGKQGADGEPPPTAEGFLQPKNLEHCFCQELGSSLQAPIK